MGNPPGLRPSWASSAKGAWKSAWGMRSRVTLSSMDLRSRVTLSSMLGHAVKSPAWPCGRTHTHTHTHAHTDTRGPRAQRVSDIDTRSPAPAPAAAPGSSMVWEDVGGRTVPPAPPYPPYPDKHTAAPCPPHTPPPTRACTDTYSSCPYAYPMHHQCRCDDAPKWGKTPRGKSPTRITKVGNLVENLVGNHVTITQKYHNIQPSGLNELINLGVHNYILPQYGA